MEFVTLYLFSIVIINYSWWWAEKVIARSHHNVDTKVLLLPMKLYTYTQKIDSCLISWPHPVSSVFVLNGNSLVVIHFCIPKYVSRAKSNKNIKLFTPNLPRNVLFIFNEICFIFYNKSKSYYV